MRKMLVFLVAATALAPFVSATEPARESEVYAAFPIDERRSPAITMSRRFKNEYNQSTETNNGRVAGEIEEEDYSLIDPAPNAREVKTGPIEHGNPLIPYIPHQAPAPAPSHP